MNIVTRAQWGAVAPKSRTRLHADRVTMLVLHHTTGTYSGHQTVRQIQAFHMGPSRGWADIGYNFLIAPDGTVFEGRGWDVVGAHAKDRNSVSIGVAFIGDGRKSVPDAAKQSILLLAREADRRFGKLERVGHRDVGQTVCPGDVLFGWWKAGPSLAQDAPAAPKPPSRVPTLGAGEVSSQGISEPPVDDWKYRPSWVPKADWQRLIDWRRR